MLLIKKYTKCKFIIWSLCNCDRTKFSYFVLRPLGKEINTMNGERKGPEAIIASLCFLAITPANASTVEPRHKIHLDSILSRTKIYCIYILTLINLLHENFKNLTLY